MLTCGLKLTHDAAIALLNDRKLVFSVEIEKLRNFPRYSQMEDLLLVEEILSSYGFSLPEVDHFAVDGWGGSSPSDLALANGGESVALRVAGYHDNGVLPVFGPAVQRSSRIGSHTFEYNSYFHVSGHVAGAYCTSPFAANRECSYVLIWDGGTFPRLYYVDGERQCVRSEGVLFPVMGHIYATAGNFFGPFPSTDDPSVVAGHSIAGKLMAYVALGNEQQEVVDTLAALWDDHFSGAGDRAEAYRQRVNGWGLRGDVVHMGRFFLELRRHLGGGFSDEDVLASLHAFLTGRLLDALHLALARSQHKGGKTNLCLAGGSALNIKWNTAIRESGLFRDVWVPPFPNDAGSALGTALCNIIHRSGTLDALEWHVRSGPALIERNPNEVDGWTKRQCGLAEVAQLLHTQNRPVIILDGPAELGPRALGGRSIVAPATTASMKTHLNHIKQREWYRPVAPICLEEQAPEVFSPGTPDPYMLFEHLVRPRFRSVIPAVVHLDGTARLQTVNVGEPVLWKLLTEYRELSGVPVLCNTSANHLGCGFFPDVASAAAWGKVEHIWSDGHLYTKNGYGQ